MLDGSTGACRVDSFALVTYIPDPLGVFLDKLRVDLIPGCSPHAHVTLMPPRSLPHSEEAAWQQIWDNTHQLPAFELEATKISVFPKTSVIYVELGLGRETLVRIHELLSRDALAYDEPYPYHPHITLAQEIPPGKTEEIAIKARARWDAFPYSRRFPVERLTFVKNVALNKWRDLACVELQKQPSLTAR